MTSSETDDVEPVRSALIRSSAERTSSMTS